MGPLTVDRGLLLTVRRHNLAKHPANWEEMKAFFAGENPILGQGFRPMVFDGFNRFGPSERYASYYRGNLEVPSEGKYAFCTISDDASFLFVDGKLVVGWPGEHTFQGGERGERQGEVELSAGVHWLEYYHEEITGEQLAVAGWKRSGEAQFQPIPPSAFRPLFEAALTAVTRREATVTADFAFTSSEELEVPGVSMIYLSAKAALYPEAEGLELRWDFGDGQEARGKAVDHVYFDPGMYLVTLRVVRSRPGGGGGDVVDEVTQRFNTEVQMTLEGATHGTHQFLAVVRGYDPAKLSGAHLERVLQLFDYVEQTQGSLPFLVELRMRQTRAQEIPIAGRARTALKLAAVMWSESRDEAKAFPLLQEAEDPAAPMEVRVEALELELDTLCHGASRQPAPALEKIAKLLEGGEQGKLADPPRRRLEIALGDGLRFRGDQGSAGKAYQKAGEWDRESGKRRAESDARKGEVDRSHFLLRTRNLLHRRELDEARRTLQEWVWEYPGEKLDGAYSLLVAQYLQQVGRFAQALDELRDFVRACPQSNLAPAAILLEGEIRLREERREDAAEIFRRLLKDYPESPQVEEARKHVEGLSTLSKPAEPTKQEKPSKQKKP